MTWVQIISGAPKHPYAPSPLLCHVSSSAGKSGWAELTPNGRWLQVAHKFVFIWTRKKHFSSHRCLFSDLLLLSLLCSHTHDINCTAIDRSRIPLCCAQVLVLFLAFPLHLYLACLFRNEKWNWVLRAARHQLPSSIIQLRLLQLQLQLLLSRFLLAVFPFSSVKYSFWRCCPRHPLSEYT